MATDNQIAAARESHSKEHVYPQELGDKRFPNMVKFYIHAKKMTAVKTNSAYTAFSADEKQTLANENRSKAENYNSIATQASVIAGAIGGYTAGKMTSGDDVSKFMELAKGAVGGAGAGIAAANLTDNMESVKLLETISLYVPQSVISAYTANWDEVDLGAFAGALATGTGSLADLASTEALELGGRGMVSAAAAIPSAAGLGDLDLGNVFEATSKKVANPRKEQLFKSMGFRQFSFNYMFSPKNEKESLEVERIIQLFKENMHPDVSKDGMFLIYPSEFRIEFHHSEDGKSSSLNKYLPKISSCALKSCKVTYGPDGMLNTFQNSGGRPTETTMELQFQELETLTRKRIEEGKPAGMKTGGF